MKRQPPQPITHLILRAHTNGEDAPCPQECDIHNEALKSPKLNFECSTIRQDAIERLRGISLKRCSYNPERVFAFPMR
jgi:hypothetical protein